MIEDGYAYKNGGTIYTISYPDNIIESITAIEIKKRDVEKAINQANRYLDHFANRAMVMIDADRLHLAERHISTFQGDGLGLMALSENDLTQERKPTEYRSHAENKYKPYLSKTAYELYTNYQLNSCTRISNSRHSSCGFLDPVE